MRWLCWGIDPDINGDDDDDLNLDVVLVCRVVRRGRCGLGLSGLRRVRLAADSGAQLALWGFRALAQVLILYRKIPVILTKQTQKKKQAERQLITFFFNHFILGGS